VNGTFPQWERGAPYWVWVLCCINTTLFAVLAVGAGVFGLSAVAEGMPPVNLLMAVALPTAMALLMAALTRAWRLRRTWAWWVLVVVGFLDGASTLLEFLLAGPGVSVVLQLAVATTVLVLLFRSSSRAWGGRARTDPQAAAVS
jgi:hypothetical protein